MMMMMMMVKQVYIVHIYQLTKDLYIISHIILAF